MEMKLPEIERVALSPPLVAMLTFTEYQKEALVTASMGKGRAIEGFVRVCGLVGEAGELRDECCRWLQTPGAGTDALNKELGDVLWYAATLSEWFGLGVHFNFATLQEMAGRVTFEPSFKDVVLARSSKLAELMKKHLGHDKPIEDFKGAELELMQDVFVAIAYVANTVGLDLVYVAAENIRKLRIRHGGGGFTAQGQNSKADERRYQQGPNDPPPFMGHDAAQTVQEAIAAEKMKGPIFERTEQQAENDGDLA